MSLRMNYKSPYGTEHTKPNRMYDQVRRRARSNSHQIAVQIVEQHNPEGQAPFTHPCCHVEHRRRGRAVECARRLIWRWAEEPEFLAHRRTMREFLEVMGCLERSGSA